MPELISQQGARDRSVPQPPPAPGPCVEGALEGRIPTEHERAPSRHRSHAYTQLEVEGLHALLPVALESLAVGWVGDQDAGRWRRRLDRRGRVSLAEANGLRDARDRD